MTRLRWHSWGQDPGHPPEPWRARWDWRRDLSEWWSRRDEWGINLFLVLLTGVVWAAIYYLFGLAVWLALEVAR